MADISEQNTNDLPLPDNAQRCNNINFAIEKLRLTNKSICEVEAKIQLIPQFPFCYGPDDLRIAKEELNRWITERSENLGELNLCLPCPITECLHNSQFGTKISPSLNQNKKRQHDATNDNNFQIPSKTAKQSKITKNNNTITETGKSTINTLNRNRTIFSRETRPDLSYAQALNPLSQPPKLIQMEPLNGETAETTPIIPLTENRKTKNINNPEINQTQTGFTMFDAIQELKSFFQLYPGLVQACEKMSKTQDKNDKLNIFLQGICTQI
ncbi:hypothetical protein NPIL_108211 [Nephila pilipes]|uniref:Uncharacterized protein n=1 Tax=Nephila pilipes TaxID=299642 RepID=A0A8X6MXB3_NEPPI|nr:hypothetical protein NPIL_108211 [Nephila pilipes]